MYNFMRKKYLILEWQTSVSTENFENGGFK